MNCDKSFKFRFHQSKVMDFRKESINSLRTLISQHLMLQIYLALLCFNSRIIGFPSVLQFFLFSFVFLQFPLPKPATPTLLRPHAVWKLLHCIEKSMGGTKEEEEQGAVVEVIRKPDPQLGFKGNWISLQYLLISLDYCWSCSY